MKCLLVQKDEQKLADFMYLTKQEGATLKRETVRQLAALLLRNSPREECRSLYLKHEGNKYWPSDHWFRNFSKRHPETDGVLALVQPQDTDKVLQDFCQFADLSLNPPDLEPSATKLTEPQADTGAKVAKTPFKGSYPL